jgi:hypothetical protein
MDTLISYQDIVRNLVLEHATHKPAHGEITPEVIIDEAKGHYELLQIGWQGGRRVHSAVIHIDIVDDKVWIQYDGTSPGIASELTEAGIPREAIVLAFHPPEVRQHTGYALA